MCLRLKRNGKDSKEIPLVVQGFQAYINNLFWFLPFSNPEQAYEVLANLEPLSDELWTSKGEEAMSEHYLLQRISGWDGKLELQTMSLERRALPVPWPQPLVPPRWSASDHDLWLGACACELLLGCSPDFLSSFLRTH